MQYKPQPINRVLIANRGEIACRIIRACRAMGITTVAVYSEADRGAPHTQLADLCAYIGKSPPRDSYLRGDAIIATAKEFYCDAIHPGYGFLSESVDFAASVISAGLIWIGPPPNAMRAMGSKTAGRNSALAAGIPVAPAINLTEFTNANVAINPAFLQHVENLGYPVLVKAVAGGGGKGMRLVHSASELSNAIESAQREAQNAFSDGQVFIEKYIVNPRHIEIQVFGDVFGNVVHLFERECSVQRRHQKIIEESPSTFLDDSLRRRMGEAAVKLAKSVGYVNAGTMEFLVNDKREFYFLEMNTRLQVEHPVTEMVTGLDLVQLQLKVAMDEELPTPLLQPEKYGLIQRGHAIECRICAEDPENQFFPSVGKLTTFIEPNGVRIESGIRQGGEISVHYDSMIAKLIAHADTRASAIHQMKKALLSFQVEGVKTNICFLQDVINHPKFILGDTTTHFIENYFQNWYTPEDIGMPDPKLTPSQDWINPWHSANRFRIGGTVATNTTSALTNRKTTETRKRGNVTATTHGRIESPMPGVIRQILVETGNSVSRGATLIIIEAMKMEMRITAPFEGVVQKVMCEAGQVVEKGQILAELQTR
jgi:acetyl/propionyl-CoA carboxylase alpha subunit